MVTRHIFNFKLHPQRGRLVINFSPPAALPEAPGASPPAARVRSSCSSLTKQYQLRAFPSEFFDKANMNLNFEKFKVQVWKKMCLVQANFF
jgi:hypothetical protein